MASTRTDGGGSGGDGNDGVDGDSESSNDAAAAIRLNRDDGEMSAVTTGSDHVAVFVGRQWSGQAQA